MPVLFSTVIPTKVKTMDDINLSDYKKCFYSCEICEWAGTELELDVVSKIDVNLICCPNCKNDDVRIINGISKVI